MITSDYHMHTTFSGDGEGTPEEMAEAALKKGLQTICITDHEDYGQTGEEVMVLSDYEKYVHTIQDVRETYKGRLKINLGIEIGLKEDLGPHYREFIGTYPFDFVIGSLHYINGLDPYYGEIFEEYSDEEVYRMAFREMTECIRKIEDFDVLGHLDYVVRYGKYQEKEYSYQKFSDEIDELLHAVIETGRGIELNTAGIKYGLSFAHPHPDVLKRYRELGGEIITVGSDAHHPKHVGYEFGQAEEILTACGFKYYTEFKSRKPVFKQIR